MYVLWGVCGVCVEWLCLCVVWFVYVVYVWYGLCVWWGLCVCECFVCLFVGCVCGLCVCVCYVFVRCGVFGCVYGVVWCL